ncbi:MAG: hypothetical protein RL329_90 [Bacteroidota bacterium]
MTLCRNFRKQPFILYARWFCNRMDFTDFTDFHGIFTGFSRDFYGIFTDFESNIRKNPVKIREIREIRTSINPTILTLFISRSSVHDKKGNILRITMQCNFVIFANDLRYIHALF